jgi:TolB protein
MAGALMLVIASVGLFFFIRSLRSNRPAQAAVEPPPVIYVTATPLSALEIVQTATSILPPEYLLSLSQTPIFDASSGNLLTSDGATPTPAFVSQNPGVRAFSLAQSQIVYVCHVNFSDEICLMNGDGSESRQLTSIPGTDWYPSISPDGTTIYFSSQRRNGPFNIYSMNTSGGDLQQLTRNIADNYAPELSPDGTRIVFTSTFGESGDQNIWVMNANGSNPFRLTDSTANDIDPSWASDGTQISFTSNRSGTNELFIMNADGSNLRQMTSSMSIGGRNAWSVDGNWLTFYAGPGSDKDVYIVPIECSLLGSGCTRSLIRQLTYGGSNKGPSFSPDGQWITFASARDGNNDIFIMRLDGSDVRQLTFSQSPNVDWQPRWGVAP